MVRVGSLYDQTLLPQEIRDNKTKMSSQEQIDAILAETRKLNKRKEKVYQKLIEKVAKEGIRLYRADQLPDEKKWSVFPVRDSPFDFANSSGQKAAIPIFEE